MFSAWWSGKTCTKSKHNSAKRRYRQKLRVWFSGRGLGCHVQALDSMITIIQNEKHISKSWSGHQSGFYRDTDPTAHGFGAERGLEGWGGVRDWIYFWRIGSCAHRSRQGQNLPRRVKIRGRTVGTARAQRRLLAEPSFPQGISVFFSFSLCVCAHVCVWVSSPVLTCAHPSRGQWSMWGFFLSHSILLFWDRLSVTDPRALCSC